METVKMRERRQLTLPAGVVEQVQIKTNDALQVTVVNGVIQLTPLQPGAGKKVSLRPFLGVAKGVYQKNEEASLSQYVEELRNEWE
ncbi:MAG: AbrB/MazE/SpoVT family DNA-binding domain-containing protein [Betaproteobacteria bacterium]|nr:AbrB/MazE/SpoVT family DNA-binding domain-containing protein [Betaproteobacteria bacterium]